MQNETTTYRPDPIENVIEDRSENGSGRATRTTQENDGSFHVIFGYYVSARSTQTHNYNRSANFICAHSAPSKFYKTRKGADRAIQNWFTKR